MTYTVTSERLADIVPCTGLPDLKWDPVFVLPAWLEVWRRHFGQGAELDISVIRNDDHIIGIAPLQLAGSEARLAGDPNLFDYMDFVVAPGSERGFYGALLRNLAAKGVTHMVLEHVRPESSILTYLTGIGKDEGWQVSVRQSSVSLELDLPDSWDDYLNLLGGKQRHEVRRKLRRLTELGSVSYRAARDSAGIAVVMDKFFELFVNSRSDKAAFMTAPMRSFFEDMADTMAGLGLLGVGILELDGAPAAMVVYFDYNNNIYLYNSGYDPRYDYLSVGLISKIFCIKDAIENGRKKFDFMKGNEAYKHVLGGNEVPLYTCRLSRSGVGAGS